MADKESVKMELVNQGQQLAKVSSEVRAADIEGKLLRLEDKWQHVTSVMSFRYVILDINPCVVNLIIYSNGEKR